MKYNSFRAVLRDTRDGTTAENTFQYKKPVSADQIIFNWTQHNNSCDCNRSRYVHPGDKSKKLECHGGPNVIELVELWADNERLI